MDRDIELLPEIIETSDEVKPLKFKSTAATFDTKLWVLASGKGGVGKTFITSSFGLTLSKMGHSVLILDLDFAGANIHTMFGMKPSHENIRHFFEGTKSLRELVVTTEHPRLSYIQGLWDAWAPTDYSIEQIAALIPELRALPFDYILVDLGPGALSCHLELFKAADESFIITSPEPTSIEKTYRFLEAHMCYSIKNDCTPEAYHKLVQTLRLHRQNSTQKNFSFRTHLAEQDGIQCDYFENFLKKSLRLIVNCARSPENEELGHSIKSVCYKYYDLGLDYAGCIDYDNAVWQSIRAKESTLTTQPFSHLIGQFLATCKHLIDPKELCAVV